MDFRRINALPPYVFAEINNLKVLKASTDKATKEAEELLKTEWQKAGGII